MVIVDGDRRYVEVNPPARLFFRLSMAEMRERAIGDLAPPQAMPMMEAAWARLLDAGCVAGPYEAAEPDGRTFQIVYWGLANVLPGRHLIAFAPADWSDEKLGALELDGHEPSPPPLTPREQQILQLAAEGLSGPRIAERLVVSPETVKTHFANLYEKLGVSDRAAAVARGLRLALID
jgi:DNA-binding CsgD family transcriptional regulator